jgi:hypothetical protein
MASKRSIAELFARMEGRGYLQPEPWRTGTEAERRRAVALAIDVWAEDLADVTDDDLDALGRAYARSGERWWPTPGQLLALGRRTATASDAMATPDAAWGHVLAGMGTRWGYYRWPWSGEGEPTAGRQPLHDDPVIDAALWAGVSAVGGWVAMCHGDPDNAANRAAFRAAYAAERTRLLEAAGSPLDRPAIGAANRPALTDGGGR